MKLTSSAELHNRELTHGHILIKRNSQLVMTDINIAGYLGSGNGAVARSLVLGPGNSSTFSAAASVLLGSLGNALTCLCNASLAIICEQGVYNVFVSYLDRIAIIVYHSLY